MGNEPSDATTPDEADPVVSSAPGGGHAPAAEEPAWRTKAEAFSPKPHHGFLPSELSIAGSACLFSLVVLLALGRIVEKARPEAAGARTPEVARAASTPSPGPTPNPSPTPSPSPTPIPSPGPTPIPQPTPSPQPREADAPLPNPSPAAAPEVVRLEVRGVLLPVVLRVLAEREGCEVELPEGMNETVTERVDGMTAAAAFDRLVDAHGYGVVRTGGRIVVTRAPAPTPAPAPPEATAAPGKFELELASYPKELAQAVVWYLGTAARSPIGDRPDLAVYATEPGSGGLCAVRIRGFGAEDAQLLERVKALPNFTGKGSFANARFVPTAP